MKPLSSRDIFGNWATLLLPINDDESIDYARLEREIDAIVAARVNGVYSNGTAGEFYTLSEQEFDDTAALLARQCEAAKLPFQIGVSHMSPQISLARLRRARSLRPSAFQVILPDWFPPTGDEAVAFLRRMAEEADPIGLVLYNPPHAKRLLGPKEITLLAESTPQLVGVKTAAGDQTWWDQLGPAARRLSIFAPGHQLATQYASGAAGAYSNVACLHPAGAQRWYELIRAGNPAGMEIQSRLQEFFDRHIIPFVAQQKYPNAAADKLLAAIGGWADVGTRLRWPYRWIEQQEAERLRPIARQQLPELF